MKKYYKIPMTERIVSANGQTLFQILQDNYPDLYNREKGRVSLTYEVTEPGVMTPELEKVVEAYNAETRSMYKAMGVPQFIIGFQVDDEPPVEYATKTPLTTYGYNCVLSFREVPQLEAYNYLDEESNYLEIVDKLFVKKEEPKSFRKIVREVLTGKR